MTSIIASEIVHAFDHDHSYNPMFFVNVFLSHLEIRYVNNRNPLKKMLWFVIHEVKLEYFQSLLFFPLDSCLVLRHKWKEFLYFVNKMSYKMLLDYNKFPSHTVKKGSVKNGKSVLQSATSYKPLTAFIQCSINQSSAGCGMNPVSSRPL